ncbi:DUF485 domain-containing protein [Stackebrandtia soli]|uniref:DUF485 domain-containing protein n=1 Tax=Stackebrandtia soli TaxID=1892856 RepID=UPI0039E99B0C
MSDLEQPGPEPGTNLAIANSPEFARLRLSLRRFVFPVTIGFLAWYALYVLLSTYATEWMRTPVFGNVNVALLFGVLQFVSTFGIAWAYSRYADRHLDPAAEAIKADIEAADADVTTDETPKEES